jgi:arylsulfatase A-like enzyme
LRDTLVLFTSDHGEFMGDRGLGEKELFHDEIVRVPFLVADPDPRADVSRGRADARVVEAVDVVPTILAALGIPGAAHRIEGRSLLALTRDEATAGWRDCAFCELDYSFRRAARPRAGRVRVVRSWPGPRNGNTSTGTGFGRSCSTSRATRWNWSTSAQRRPRTRPHRNARTAFRLAGHLSHRTTIDDALVEARTDGHRGTAFTLVSGDALR